MATIHPELSDELQAFIRAQHMFFISTAPLAADGLVNASPKGLDTLRILDRLTLAYLDLTGSGAETIAHLRENGRFALMFCSFANKPLILRIHGTGEVIESHDPAFETMIDLFPRRAGTRAIIKLTARRIADSCGWGVPVMDFTRERDTYGAYIDKLDAGAIQAGQRATNLASLDGLPALSEPTREDAIGYEPI